MILSYIQFLLKSSNEHGIHSPFIFSLVTKCFYNKKQFTEYQSIKKYSLEKITYKERKFLYRLPIFFSFKTMFIVEKNHFFSDFFRRFTSLEKTTQKVDFIVITDFSSVEIKDLLAMMHNDSLLLVVSPYKSQQSKLFWQQILENKLFTATIDTFNFGLAFVRNEQTKQHFTIRM